MKPLLLLLLCGITAIYAQERCFSDGGVRLQGLGTTLAGRVEFCRDGVWGTVCANLPFTPWSEKNAQVVCRVLEFSGALNSILHDRLPLEARIQDGDGTPIHNRVTCFGNEESLDQCDLLSNSSCTHAQDVAITCRPLSVNGANGQDGDVLLVGDTRNGYGAVLLRNFRTIFIGICPDDGTFDTTEANIVCRQLGYASGSVIQYSGSLDSSGSRAEGFNCNPEDTFLNFATCNYDLISTDECSSPNIVGVACISSNVPTGAIRLAGGTNSREGRVEIYFDGKWGRVCSTDWDRTDGEVACSELGFGTDSVSISQTTSLFAIDNRVQPVWLGDLECLSTSETLNECPHLEPTGFADCYNTFSRFAVLDCGSDSGSGGISSGAITGIVFAVIFIAFFVLPFGWAYGKEYWNNRERYSVYRCLVWPFRACGRCLDNCSMPDWSPSRNTNARTTGSTHAAFSLSTNTPATHATELTPTNRPTTSTSESAPEPEPERDEREPELTKTAPPSYQAASHFPAADPTDLPPPYPGPPKPAEAGYPTAPGAYPPPTGGAYYPPVGVGAYPPGGPGYPPGDLAYPPVAVPGAGLQGYPPPTQAGAAYPPTLELAYPPATATAPYPVEIPQQTIDPVLAEELANAPREAAPGSVPGELPYPVELTLDQPPQSSYN